MLRSDMMVAIDDQGHDGDGYDANSPYGAK